MKPIRHGEDSKSSHKWGSKGDQDFSHIPPIRDSKHIPLGDKHIDREEQLQLRKPLPHSNVPSGEHFSKQESVGGESQGLLPAGRMMGAYEGAKLPQPLKCVANESIFGNFSKPLRGEQGSQPTGISDRDRRIMLRDIERKKRISGLPAAIIEPTYAYGHLSAAGANIAFTQRDSEVESIPAIRGSHASHEAETDSMKIQAAVRCGALQVNEKGMQGPNAYCSQQYEMPTRIMEERPVVLPPPSSKTEENGEHLGLETEGKRKKDDYLKFLQKQMAEQQERKKLANKSDLPAALPPVGGAEALGTDYVRYKKRDVDLETVEKREKQKLYMQNELNKQIEERKTRKMMEKQKEKEEAEREEQRLRREQSELSVKHKDDLAEIGEKYRGKRSGQNLFQPSEENTFAYVVQGVKPVMHVAGTKMMAEEPIAIKAARVEVSVPVPRSAVLQAPTISMPAIAESKPQCVSPGPAQNIIEDYQKQIESLKAERQLAKEEALIYKEQLLKEREIQLQAFMSKMQAQTPLLPPPQVMAPIRPLQHLDSGPAMKCAVPQPPTRMETKETCEESIESSSRRVPTSSSNNEAINVEYFYNNKAAGEVDVFEQSLSSNTKLVTANDVGKSVSDMYRTWKPNEIQQHLAAKAAALKEERTRKATAVEDPEEEKKRVNEVAIQTAEEDNSKSQEENDKTSASSDNLKMLAQNQVRQPQPALKPRHNVTTEMDEIEEDYAQASFESDEDAPVEVKENNTTDDNVLFESRSGRKVELRASDSDSQHTKSAKQKPKTINVFKRLEEAAARSQEAGPLRLQSSKEIGTETTKKRQRPCTVSKQEARYKGVEKGDV